MIDPDRVLQPLVGEQRAVERLTTYESPSELAESIVSVHDALDRSLRLLLRSDTTAPDDLRMTALSTRELPSDRLVPSLRQRELISLQLAGMMHEVEQVVDRARTGGARAADGDVMRRAVDQLRIEMEDRADRSVGSVAPRAPAPPPLTDPPQEVPPAVDGGDRRVFIAVGVIAIVIATVVVALVMSGGSDIERGIQAFQAGDRATAEGVFQQVAREDPENVTASLYLGRIYRRQGRYEQAGTVLLAAVDRAPDDADVRRELGHLFLDLGRPGPAVQQYRRAPELAPDDDLNWIGLIRALRAAGDPAAEDWLRRAPVKVRAALASGIG
jgi:Flp pilus assembly protein TadD